MFVPSLAKDATRCHRRIPAPRWRFIRLSTEFLSVAFRVHDGANAQLTRARLLRHAAVSHASFGPVGWLREKRNNEAASREESWKEKPKRRKPVRSSGYEKSETRESDCPVENGRKEVEREREREREREKGRDIERKRKRDREERRWEK